MSLPFLFSGGFSESIRANVYQAISKTEFTSTKNTKRYVQESSFIRNRKSSIHSIYILGSNFAISLGFVSASDSIY